MAEDTTVTIAIRANVEAFKKSMAEARKSVKDTSQAVKTDAKKMSKEVNEAAGKKSGFKQIAESMKGVSPVLDSLIGSVGDMRDRLKGAGKAGKVAMAAVGTAVAGLAIGIGVMLGKALMDATGKLAKLADPVRFDKAATEMKESIRTLKTSLGELASPVFEVMAKAVSALAKGLTWVVEKVLQLVGALQGLLGLGRKANQTIKGTADAMDEAGSAADAGLASFDKLNTLNIGEMGDMDQALKLTEVMDDMRKKGEELRAKIADALKPVSEVIEKIKGLMNLNLGQVWDNFKQSAVNAWIGIKDTASSVWSGIVQMAAGAWDTVKAVALAQWENIKGAVLGVWDSIKTGVVQGFTAISGTLKGMFTSVVDVFKHAWDRVFGAIQGAIQWILDRIQWVSDKINGLKTAISSKVEGVKNWAGEKWENFKGALGFAKGGLFQPNNPQLVMVGDNKTEPEVIAPRSMIMDAMRQVIGETGMAGGRTENITLTIDGKTLARYTYDDMQAEGRRRGMGAVL